MQMSPMVNYLVSGNWTEEQYRNILLPLSPVIFIYFTFEFIVSSKQILGVEGKLFRNASMLDSTSSLREYDTQQFPLHRRNLFLICLYLSIMTPCHSGEESTSLSIILLC